MQENHEPSQIKIKRRINIKKLALTLALIYGVIMAVSIIFRQQNMMAKQAQDAQDLSRQVEQVQRANSELERKLQFTQTEEYIERIARDQLGYVKEGEIKIVGRE